MNKILLFLLILLLSQTSLLAQLNDDSYDFRNDMLVNYDLFVKSNDTNSDNLKIIDVVKVSNNSDGFNLTISTDSNYINIYSANDTMTSGSFYYKTLDPISQSIDSAYVNFERKEILGDFYPGDCNKDNLVNHFDLFPIGLMYGKYGSPRNLADTNLSFGVPKKVGDWFFTYKGINAKHADVDGNGIINENDVNNIHRNFGKSNGTYLPSFSFASKSTKLTFSVDDTLEVNSSMQKISIPILIESPTTISAYGLGFSYSVRLFDASNPALSRYYEKTSYHRTNVWDELETLFIIDTISFPEHINVGYSRKNLVNGDMDPQGGVIDITIDDILIGIPNPGDVTSVNLYLKEVALIDNSYRTIPISPISKQIFIRKAGGSSSSIQNSIQQSVFVYPTLISDKVNIRNQMKEPIQYAIYNSLGQVVVDGELIDKLQLSTSNWSAGIYYLKNKNTKGAIKIQKR